MRQTRKPCQNFLARVCRGATRVDCDCQLIGLRSFQSGQLAVQQTRRHVVVGPMRQPPQQLLGAGIQECKGDRRRHGHTQAVAISLLQRGASGDSDSSGLESLRQRAAQTIQPRPAIFIGQRYSRTHPGYRLGCVEVIAFQECTADFGGKRRAQRRFPTAGYAHHDDGQRTQGV